MTLYLPVFSCSFEDRVVGHLDVAFLHVEFAGDRRQVQRLRVGEVGEAHLVDVGKLVAVLVDADVVRIALQREHRIADAAGRNPGRHRRTLGILRRRVPAREQLGPGLEPGGGRLLSRSSLGV